MEMHFCGGNRAPELSAVKRELKAKGSAKTRRNLGVWQQSQLKVPTWRKYEHATDNQRTKSSDYFSFASEDRAVWHIIGSSHHHR